MKSNSFMDREFKDFSETLGKALRVSHFALPAKPTDENAQQEKKSQPSAPPDASDKDAQ